MGCKIKEWSRQARVQVLIENGVFRIPLFHGTSSIYLKSINEHGLGGANPIRQYGVTTFLRDLLALADETLTNDDEWKSCRFAVQWMVNQDSFRDDANFQHGDAYLTPSRRSAVGYALTNPFGSELITQSHRLYRILEARAPEGLRARMLDQHPLVAVFSLEAKPILIVARNVTVAGLLSEGGEAPEKSINHLQELWSVFGEGREVLNINFRLRAPLPISSFTVEILDEEETGNPFGW